VLAHRRSYWRSTRPSARGRYVSHRGGLVIVLAIVRAPRVGNWDKRGQLRWLSALGLPPVRSWPHLAAQYARIALWNVRLIGHACTFLRARDLFLAARAPLLFPARALPSRLRTLAPLPGRVRAPALNLLAGLCICSARRLAIACCMRCAWRNMACRCNCAGAEVCPCSCSPAPPPLLSGPMCVC
jgi:hypothetical protein